MQSNNVFLKIKNINIVRKYFKISLTFWDFDFLSFIYSFKKYKNSISTLYELSETASEAAWVEIKNNIVDLIAEQINLVATNSSSISHSLIQFNNIFIKPTYNQGSEKKDDNKSN